MTLAVALLLGVAAAYVAGAAVEMMRLGLGFRQALFYLPFKLAYRISDQQIRTARQAEAPVIYVVIHQSRIDPALMLALLPQDTLHILDPESAAAAWLEPWRELARTIAFNAEHVFVSRRLVRHLRGKGRLAVYIPDAIEPDTKAFRLYRAVARIAARAEAGIVPICIGRSHHLPFSPTGERKARGQWLPRLQAGVLKRATFADLIERNGGQSFSLSNMLFDRVAESRLAGANLSRSLFQAMRDSARCSRADRDPVEDSANGPIGWKQLFIEARILGHRLRSQTAPGEAVGVMLPNSNALIVSLIGLFSASRVAALIDPACCPAAVTSSVRTAVIRTFISSRDFVEQAGLAEIVEAAEQGGARFMWLEDVTASATMMEKLAASLFHRLPLARQNSKNAAVILFTADTDGVPRAVVYSHRGLLTNCMQATARITTSTDDVLLNILPPCHSFGLTAGILTPLMTGMRLVLYPTPPDDTLAPQVVADVAPTILPATDALLAGCAQAATRKDLASLRLVVGGDPIIADTRRIWSEKFGLEILEGYGLTAAAPIIAVNSALHNRHGAVGRLLPGMTMRIEPVEGISTGGKLWISGPNLLLGTMTAQQPGKLIPPAGMSIDTHDIVSVDRDGFITIKGRA